jgi:hypothetical protein
MDTMTVKQHIEQIIWRLTGLLRSRVVICMVGLYVLNNKPEIGQWVVSLCGLALGVSAVDALKGIDNGKSSK